LCKYKIFLIVTLILTFGISLCNAESWEQVDNSTWVDVDSIAKIQMEHDRIIKAITKEHLKDNNYYMRGLLINKDAKTYCYEVVERYDKDGKLLGKVTVNPKDKISWMNYISDNKVIQKIIERATER